MAKIFDPDLITYDVDVSQTTEQMILTTGTKLLTLYVQTPLLDDSPGAESGVTGKCIYSKCKEIWKTDSDLNKFRFPIQMIYEASFVWINGWGPGNDQTRDLFRDAGFKEVDGRENACVISLGSMYQSTDQGYYTNDFATEFATAKINLDKTGEINENIQIKGTGGSPDNSGYLKVFLREEQSTFASYDLISEQGLAALTYQAYRLPLANGDDSLKAIDNDTTIVGDVGSESGVTYSELTIDYIVGSLFGNAQDNLTTINVDEVLQDDLGRWYRCTTQGTIDTTDATDLGSMGGSGTAVFEVYPGERLIGTTYYAFNRILDVEDVGTTAARLKEIHSWAQWKLRQAGDINDDGGGDAFGTVYGNVALPFTDFIGDTLHTKPGVYIDNFDNNDKNDLNFWDITVQSGGLDAEYAPLISTVRIFPFTAAGNMNFSQNYVDEVDNTTRYTMYFEYITSQAMTSVVVSGSSGASCVLDYSGTDAGLLDHLLTGNYIAVTGFTTESGNNGLYVLTGDPTTNTIAVDKVDGVNPTDEAIGDACVVKEDPFESPGAVIVDDNSVVDIDGEISAASIGFDFDYTNNVQGGRTGNIDASVFLVAIAYDGAQYVVAAHTITKTTGQNIAVNGADELNYDNPV